MHVCIYSSFVIPVHFGSLLTTLVFVFYIDRSPYDEHRTRCLHATWKGKVFGQTFNLENFFLTGFPLVN